MKIAVVSDSHDHIWNMRKMVAQANDAGVELMIHCGDLISPFMLEELDLFQGHIHLILGNNSGDQVLLMKRLRKREQQVTFHGWMGQVEADGMNFGFVHAPDIAAVIARSGDFDMVFFGHTHLWKQERVGNTILLNPGEIMGKKEPAGWALIDTGSGCIRHVLIDEQDESLWDKENSARLQEIPDWTEACHISQRDQERYQPIAMTVHARPDLYRAFMRCVWMLIHEEGMSPLEAQNTLIEDFLRHHGC